MEDRKGVSWSRSLRLTATNELHALTTTTQPHFIMPDTTTKFSGWGAFDKDSMKGNLVSFFERGGMPADFKLHRRSPPAHDRAR